MGTLSNEKGKCFICKEEFGKIAMKNHLVKVHNKNNDNENDDNENKFLIRVEAFFNKDYWLYIQVHEDAVLKDIDIFLRNIWLECCGHLSMFEINDNFYESETEKTSINLFGRKREDMRKTRVKNVLEVGDTFRYDYDFGSTTRLQLKVIDKISCNNTKEKVTLLARNNMKIYQCEECGEKGKYFSMKDDWTPPIFLCEECALKKEYEEYYVVDIVNSPRMGVCDYIGARDIYSL